MLRGCVRVGVLAGVPAKFIRWLWCHHVGLTTPYQPISCEIVRCALTSPLIRPRGVLFSSVALWQSRTKSSGSPRAFHAGCLSVWRTTLSTISEYGLRHLFVIPKGRLSPCAGHILAALVTTKSQMPGIIELFEPPSMSSGFPAKSDVRL